jgi:hypothetical protein
MVELKSGLKHFYKFCTSSLFLLLLREIFVNVLSIVVSYFVVRSVRIAPNHESSFLLIAWD